MSETEIETLVPEKKPLAVVATRLSPAVLAGVKGLRGWDDLYPVTDAEFDAAVREFESIRLG